MSQPLIVLTTDFGLSDSYIGVMKGVIATIAPQTRVIDLTHDVRPQDIHHGAYVLKISASYFPTGTIFVTVVDPGVGSLRKRVAICTDRHYFIAP
ncbi:MAG: SAM-dependent chlorinase/fluorinase, partial [Chlorobiales bacterium]|nr:SAM-dependent chlorinase/fluorinase [Chlorobiales bacterium]